MRTLRIDADDNVAVVLDPEGAGEIPFAHKIALRPIAAGEAVLKYGVPIAFATCDIQPGEWVHVHNAQSYFVARKAGRTA